MTDLSSTFHDNEIFLTGATGFLGKIVLALLLDRYPEFKHLHILLRPANGLSAVDRFYHETLSSPPLRPIVARTRSDDLKERITVWSGDIGEPKCGLPESAPESLAGRVALLINCAGKVDFLPPLDDSFKSNVDGAEKIVAFARQVGAKLLHVSTSFVCGEADGLVEETEPILGFYPQRKGSEDYAFNHSEELLHSREMIRQIYESALPGEPSGNSHRSRELMQRLIALGRQRAASWGWVNTYTYAKSLGEQIIASAEGVEYAIVRPAIVESAWQFPFPGWIEGGRTAAPLVLMALDGLKDWPVREDAPLEVVPVDMAAAAILIAGGLLLQGRYEPIYQLGSADANPVELGSIVSLLNQEAKKRGRNGNGSLSALTARWLSGRRAGGRSRFISLEDVQEQQRRGQHAMARSERWIGRLSKMVAKTRLPGASVLDSWTRELRKLGLQARFREQTLEQYLPFVLQNRYVFESENIRLAYSQLSDADRELLPWRPERINWEDYWVHNQIEGIEKWVQPAAVRNWKFRI